MDVADIDPRDATGEVWDPCYRVEFVTTVPLAVATYRLRRAADVREVLAWADRRRGDRSLRIFVEMPAPGGGELTLLRLAGDDIESHSPSWSGEVHEADLYGE